MTRFARAKGSKASNERAPEDSTPWEVMKEQLLQAKKQNEDAKNREEAEKQRIENYENFLKEHKVQKRKATWCDFPETVNKQSEKQPNPEVPKKKKKMKKDKMLNAPKEPTAQIEAGNSEITKQKKNKKAKKNAENVETETVATSINKTVSDIEQNNEASQIKNSVVKNKKHKNKKKLNKETEKTKDQEGEEVVHQDNKKKVNNTNENSIQNRQKVKKNKPLLEGQPARRKPINDRSFQLIINGKEVELVRFDGFPIMKKDAERLEELKVNMNKKGIPKSEVQRTLKLERRRAEKALARLKRDVCYNCRKGGHNLSDCPELKSKIPGVGAAEGVCFKCGSTEHRQFECKVQKDKEFRFATCFICKEPGHIARQCPDNPKGLYPNGGSCKLCGDVTHLRKDCPTVHDQKEVSTIKLQTLDSTENIEDIPLKPKGSTTDEQQKKPKKIRF